MVTELLIEKELEILKKTVQLFISEKVIAAEMSFKKYLPQDVLMSLKDDAHNIGLYGLFAKKEWGGHGLSFVAKTILMEEAAKHRFGLYHPAADAFGSDFPSFLEKCSAEQMEKYVKSALEQGKSCFVALWEEHEDNDIEKLNTVAIKDEDGWVIHGQKVYIQNLNQSSFGVILVNCQLDNGEQNPTLFILDSTDGLELKETVLMDTQTTHSLSLENYRISDEQRIGAVGEGVILLKQWLAESQVLLAARSIGVAKHALDYGVKYAKRRITRGKPLAEFPTIRNLLAKAAITLQSVQLMVLDAARKVEAQEIDCTLSAQIVKLHATEAVSKVIDDVLQIHGGAGFAGDLPIERWYKEIRIARLDLQKEESIIENVAKSIL